MSAGLRRRMVDLGCRALQAMLPRSLQQWGWAIRCEAANIADDGKALRFTLESLCAMMPRAIAFHLLHHFSEGSPMMTRFDAILCRPRLIGMLCASGSVAIGLAYMAIAGAPSRYLMVNLVALALGMVMVAMFARTASTGTRSTGGAIAAMAAALLATTFFGAAADGATRWVHVAGLAVQPSLVLVPLMLVAFSTTVRSWIATTGVVVTALAMAVQPDRAMAGMLVLALSVLAMMRRDRQVVVALAASIIGLGVTLMRADALPAVPYVDQILYSSFDVHPVVGLAVLGGSALLLVPAIVGARYDRDHRAIYAVFATVWFAAILASALGNYPTPIVGYGGSAILGYALSLFALPKRAGDATSTASPPRGRPEAAPSDGELLVALA